jgi:hypothetical protein
LPNEKDKTATVRFPAGTRPKPEPDPAKPYKCLSLKSLDFAGTIECQGQSGDFRTGQGGDVMIGLN